MAHFDADLMHDCAESLLREANSQAATWAIVGALVGVAYGVSIGLGARDFVVIILLALISGGLGCAGGIRRANSLRLRAQQALCMARIEENTRLSARAAAERRGG